MWTKRTLNLMSRPTVDQQSRIDFLAQDSPEFSTMADELWETKHISPTRRREIYDAIDAEFERLRDQI